MARVGVAKVWRKFHLGVAQKLIKKTVRKGVGGRSEFKGGNPCVPTCGFWRAELPPLEIFFLKVSHGRQTVG